MRTILTWVAGVALLAGPLALRAQNFRQSTSFCSASGLTAGLALGDLDGDGDLDLVFANGRHVAEPDPLYLNDGAGTFYPRGMLSEEPDRSYAVVLADFDGDGSLDAIVANDTGDRSRIYLNDGRAGFRLLRGLGSGREARRGVAAGDLNGDGDPDVVLVGPGQDHAYLNGGGLSWTESPLGNGQDYSLSVALGDLDGDGDLDVAVGNRNGQPNVIHLNDGKGAFPETRPFGRGADETVSVALGDLDGDGDLDVVTGNWGEANAAYLNDGLASFTPAGSFGDTEEQTWTAVLGDMDVDGDLDAVVGMNGVTATPVDANGDGIPERWVEEARDQPGRVFLNDGKGGFTPGSSFGPGSARTRPVAVGDVDGDGDLDIAVGNDCEPNAIFYNGLRMPARRAVGRPG